MSLSIYDFEGNELGFSDKIISSYREEVFNGIGTSEFQLENNDEFVNIITENQYLILEEDGIFQDIIVGYELSEHLTIYCRSLSWLLSKMVIPPTSYTGKISSCVNKLLSVSKGCAISLGECPSISTTYSVSTENPTLFSDTLKACLDTAYVGHKVRFSHEDNSFYLDILTGKNLDFYVSENDCTLDSLTLKGDILDLANSYSLKRRMTYMGRWNPSSNSPSIYNEDSDNYTTYYEVQLDSGSYTRFGISWKDGDYIYSDTTSGKWKKSETPPEDFYVYITKSSVSDKYKWYHISHKESKEEASNELSEHKQNKDFSARSRNLVFLTDYRLGDFVKLQYTLNNKTVSIPCQFTSVVINKDNIDNTENPTLKEVK